MGIKQIIATALKLYTRKEHRSLRNTEPTGLVQKCTSQYPISITRSLMEAIRTQLLVQLLSLDSLLNVLSAPYIEVVGYYDLAAYQAQYRLCCL